MADRLNFEVILTLISESSDFLAVFRRKTNLHKHDFYKSVQMVRAWLAGSRYGESRGGIIHGEYLWSLTTVNIHTGRAELQASLNCGTYNIFTAIEDVEKALRFEIQNKVIRHERIRLVPGEFLFKRACSSLISP